MSSNRDNTVFIWKQYGPVSNTQSSLYTVCANPPVLPFIYL